MNANHDVRKAWNPHIKLFPHFIRTTSSYEHPTATNQLLEMAREARKRTPFAFPNQQEQCTQLEGQEHQRQLQQFYQSKGNAHQQNQQGYQLKLQQYQVQQQQQYQQLLQQHQLQQQQGYQQLLLQHQLQQQQQQITSAHNQRQSSSSYQLGQGLKPSRNKDAAGPSEPLHTQRSPEGMLLAQNACERRHHVSPRTPQTFPSWSPGFS